MKNIYISAILSTFFFSSHVFAQDGVSSFDVSAKVTSGCFLNTTDLNFGNLLMPLPTQTTVENNLTFQCSKNTPLKFSLLYEADSIPQGTLYTLGSSKIWSSAYNTYGIYKNGSYIGTVECLSASMVIYEPEVATFYGVSTSLVGKITSNSYGICNGSQINTSTFIAKGGYIGSTQGTLTGSQNKETIKFTILKPQTSSNWTSEYSVTSNGQQELLPLKAIIKSSENGTHHYSPDTYSGKVQINLTY